MPVTENQQNSHEYDKQNLDVISQGNVAGADPAKESCELSCT